MFIARLLTLLAVLSLACCWESPREVSRETREFEVIEIYPPKHFRVDLLGTDGRIHRSVPVSKRCIRWQEVLRGQKFSLEEATYRYSSGETFSRIDAGSICPGH